MERDPLTIEPDEFGHRTRLSLDSSIYDEVCLLCGATDANGDHRLERKCPNEILESDVVVATEID